jgi:outer membrane biosynthesis protein TonB
LALLVLVSEVALIPQEIAVRVRESQLRSQRAYYVVPSYPAAALRDQVTGVCVAELVIVENGVPSEVRVLQAPSPDIAGAMKEALAKWRFQPLGTKTRWIGKVTYYFVIANGKSDVHDPYEVPYIGPPPRRIPARARDVR